MERGEIMGQKLDELKTLLDDIYKVIYSNDVYDVDRKPQSIETLHDVLLEITRLERETDPQTLGDYLKGIATCARYIRYEKFQPNGQDTLEQIYNMLEDPSVYDCDGCGKSTLWHNLWETTSGDRCCNNGCAECSSCGDAFPRDRLNVDGVCTICISDGYYSCAYCGESFDNWDDLDSHELNCSEQYSYVCDACGEGFDDYNAWYDHIEWRNDRGGCYECSCHYIYWDTEAYNNRTCC